MSEEKKNENVILNNKEMTKEEFEEKKEKLESKKGVKVLEIGEGTHKSRIQG